MIFALGFAAFGFFGLIALANYDSRWIAVGVIAVVIGAVLAVIARIIGWIAGMGMEAAQDIIHDRYDPAYDVGQGHWRYDPYTGKPLRFKFDPYTGESLENDE